MNKLEHNSHIIIPEDELVTKNLVCPDQIQAKDFAKYPFSYYTNMDTLQKIVESGNIWARNMDEMNDLDEAALHKKEKNKVHALCFCNTRTEGIPMWYMYAGKAGDGLCIRFTPGNILKWMRQIKEVYPVRKGNQFPETVPLQIGKDVELRFGWIFYQGREGEYHFKNRWYLTESGKNIPGDCLFIKKYPWHYEREFRAVLSNRTKEDYYAFAVPVPREVMKSAVLMAGPQGDVDRIPSSIRKCFARSEKSDLRIRMEIK